MRSLLKVFLIIIVSAAALNAQQIALSFDDAPRGDGYFTGKQRTEMLIQKLKETGVEQAAFFSTAKYLNTDERKERMRKYVKAGHIIGNHTYDHLHLSRNSARIYMSDILKADSILSQFDGYKKIFRFSFLDEGFTIPLRDSMRTELKKNGFTQGYITVDNYDWYLDFALRKAHEEGKYTDLEKMRDIYIDHVWQSILFYDNIARKTLGRSPKHMLLLHENDLAALFIDDLVRHIRNNGWEIVTAEDAYDDPIAERYPDVLMNNQGRVAAIALEEGKFTKQQIVQKSEDTDYLDQLLKKANVFE